MIKYLFLFDCKANSIVFSKPKLQEAVFKDKISLIRQKTNFISMKVFEKVSSKYDKLDLQLQKVTEVIVIGCFGEGVNSRSSLVLEVFEVIRVQIVNRGSQKIDKGFRRFVKSEMSKFNNKKVESSKDVSNITKKVERRLFSLQARTLKETRKLEEINEKMEDAHEKAQEVELKSSDLRKKYSEDDNTLTIFVWGSLIIFSIFGIMYLSNIFNN